MFINPNEAYNLVNDCLYHNQHKKYAKVIDCDNYVTYETENCILFS